MNTSTRNGQRWFPTRKIADRKTNASTRQKEDTVIRKKGWLAILGIIITNLFFAGLAEAQLKLGYVNSQAVLAQYQPAIDAQKKLEREATVWNQELQAMSMEIRSLQERLEQQRLMLSEARKQELEQELQTLYIRAQQYQEEKWGEEGEFARRRAELLQPVIEKINEVIEQVGDEGSFDFIFDTIAGNLLYAQEKHDLTDKVLQHLKK
ncbi:MAG TPA: OmpH family outer membrane protein [bacterium]|nr:OmpH family outer membrane protein [bacterium]